MFLTLMKLALALKKGKYLSEKSIMYSERSERIGPSICAVP